MAKNEELMEGILAAVDEAEGGGDYVQEQDDQRLGTIGEEEGQKDEASAQGTVP
jgi:hypothetical protein